VRGLLETGVEDRQRRASAGRWRGESGEGGAHAAPIFWFSTSRNCCSSRCVASSIDMAAGTYCCCAQGSAAMHGRGGVERAARQAPAAPFTRRDGT
jgi:hypothetical protein